MTWLVAEKIFGIGIAFVVSIFVVRYLGPERFGCLAFSQSLVLLIGAFPKLGLDNIIVRMLVERPEDKTSILGTAFALKLFSGLVSIIIVIVSVGFLNVSSVEKLMIVIISGSFLFQSFDVIDYYFQSRVESSRVVRIRLIKSVFSASIKIVLVWMEAPLVYFAWTSVLESIIRALGYIETYRRVRHGKPQLSFSRFSYVSKQIASEMLKSSWPLIFSGLALSVYMRMDQLMLRTMMDESSTGQYSAAVRISESWLFLAVVITSSLYPAVLNAKKMGDKIYMNRLQQFYDLMFWLPTAICAVIYFLSDTIIFYAYGEQFAPAARVVAIYAWAGVFVFVITASSRWYLTERYETAIMFRAFSGAVTNVVLNYFLIPAYGIEGAAAATAISYGFMAVCYDALDPRGRVSFVLKLKTLFAPWRLIRKAVLYA